MNIELMSPAGNLLSFIAAFEAGTNSIYLGYKKLNARRPADNFDRILLTKVTEFAHSHNIRIYLALNIDIKPGEISEAARILKLADEIKVDAVIVKDLGVLEIVRRFFPSLELHASTQTAVTSVYGAEAALGLGFKRIVLAREMEIGEIGLLKSVPVDKEIFAEGSMCFSVSGRCLMSSWVGGRSGNRGGCTAPCRLSWECGGGKGTFFSMKDLLLAPKLKEICDAGVSAVKIEGRLKSSNWIHTIVSIYRKIIDSRGDLNSTLIEDLKKFSARETGLGHYSSHSQLTGRNEEWSEYGKKAAVTLKTNPELFNIRTEITISERNGKYFADVKCENLSREVGLSSPPPQKKAKPVSMNEIAAELSGELSIKTESIHMNIPEIMVNGSYIRKAVDEISGVYKGLVKKLNDLPELTKEEAEFVAYKTANRIRTKTLDMMPDKVIIHSENVAEFAAKPVIKHLKTIVVEAERNLSGLIALRDKYDVIVSIPPVLFASEPDAVFESCLGVLKNGINAFEINSLDGLEIVKKLETHGTLRKYCGVWMNVLNHITAAKFYELGFESLYADIEADKNEIRTLAGIIDGQFEICVSGRIPLFISRVDDPVYKNGTVFKDKIGTSVTSYKRHGLTYFVSVKPFAIPVSTDIKFDSITADLRFFDDPYRIISTKENYYSSLKDSHSFNFNERLT